MADCPLQKLYQFILLPLVLEYAHIGRILSDLDFVQVIGEETYIGKALVFLFRLILSIFYIQIRGICVFFLRTIWVFFIMFLKVFDLLIDRWTD